MPDPFQDPPPDVRSRAHRGLARSGAILVALIASTDLSGQIDMQPRVPIGAAGLAGATGSDERIEDPGPNVQMLESPNIDRFLRKAQDFLARENYASAVKLLQDVIEGRTLVEGDPDRAAETTVPAPADPSAAMWSELIESARHAVFSRDGRVYRPVHALSHELLAGMPLAGLAQYRTQHEVAAERALDEALANDDLAALQAVFERWFATRAAGRAMVAAGDRMLDSGRFREAIHTLGVLLDIYPDLLRRESGIDERYARFKSALAMHLIGDHERAGDALRSLADDHPNESLRLAGELIPIEQLAATAFDGTALDRTAERPRPADAGHPNPGDPKSGDPSAAILRSPDDRLVPLWEFRFSDPEPYRRARATDGQGRRNIVMSRGQSIRAVPKTNNPSGNPVAFHDGRIAVLDHFRLTLLESSTGRLVAANDGPDRVPDPRTGQPRLRIPAYDFATRRVIVDDHRFYVVVGPTTGRLNDVDAVLTNDLEAWSQPGLDRVWRARSNPELADATWLAAPTVFGPRLLVPALHRGAIEMICIDAASGQLIYRVPIHRGGSEFVRPPTPPVIVADGIAFCMTNAGAIAAIDALTGSLRWIRRYERTHPFRPQPRPRPSDDRAQLNPFGAGFIREVDLSSFTPSDPIAVDGMVIFAPIDGRVMHCLDGATGEPVWMVSRSDDMLHPIGHDGEQLWVAGRDTLFCIGLRSGLRRWREPITAHPSSANWRGRPTLFGQQILVPGARTILARGIADDSTWTELELPTFRPGHEPLDGPFDLQAQGPYLIANHAGGFEVYSSVRALTELAEQTTNPVEAAVWLAQAGATRAAIDVLESSSAAPGSESADAIALRLLRLCSELALDDAARGERASALALLDRARARIEDDDLLQRWHLSRIEVFRVLDDLDAIYAEQDQLYHVMSSRGS